MAEILYPGIGVFTEPDGGEYLVPGGGVVSVFITSINATHVFV